ncbi:MAG: tRNA 2-thiouridine(34) synthase MnmA [Actinomycetota bacterium]|nr:tRNA 2-thiouridine(34) synthase MnmA [Actinomycetota bacterium]
MTKWLDYFKNSRFVGPLESAGAVGQAGGGCGDVVRIYLEIAENTVTQAAFLASGCPAAIAGASACAEIVTGLPVVEAAKVGAGAIVERLADLPFERHNCVELSATALGSALEKYASADISLPGADRILVAMSGGVDSSTTAVKLHRDGHNVMGITLRLHDYAQPSPRACCTPADIDDARSVALKAGFPHLVLDMRAEFKLEVIDRFCRAYLAGRTPNPCVECNRNMRFTHLLDKAGALGASRVATGHYARILGPDTSGKYELRRAIDRAKDQSYMFWAASQIVLSKMMAPLGELRKEEVRALAAGLGLPVADKPDSQDVCFVPDGDYATFVQRKTGHTPLPGPIVDAHGAVWGEHKGLINYTVGQRKGLRVSAMQPLYVLRLDMEKNHLIIGRKSELAQKRFAVTEMNLINATGEAGPFAADVMTRYNSDPKPAVIHQTSEDTAVVELKEPSGPIAPGQSAVFYAGDLVLGGGIIT